MGLGPSWVFTTHKEHWDRQSAVVEGSARRQAASTSPCHAILSWLFLLEREKEEMKSVIAYSVGCVLSLQSQLLLAALHCKATVLVPMGQSRQHRPREEQWVPKASGQGRELTCAECLQCARSFPTCSHSICTTWIVLLNRWES